MCTLLEIGVSNAVMAAVLGLAVAAIAVVCRRPPVVYYLWVLVLLKLVTPPVWRIPVPLLAAAESVVATAEGSQLEINDAPPPGPTDSEFELSVEGPAEEFPGSESSTQIADRNPDQIAGRPAELPIAAVREAAPPRQHPRSAVSWVAVLGSVWLTGSVMWFALVGMRLWRFQRLLRRALPAPNPLQAEGQKIAAKLGLRRRFEIRVVDGQVPPVLWAMGTRPTVLLPANLLRRLDSQQQATLLAHELAHLRRGDHWIRWLELVTLGLYWWHPVVWWARQQLQRIEEECCDAWVVWALPGRARAYATALLKTLDFLCESQPAVPPVASGFAQLHFFQRRFTMILHYQPNHRLSWSRRLVLCAVWLVLLPLSPHAVSGTAPEEKTPPAAGAEAARAFEPAAEADDARASLLSSPGKEKHTIPKQNQQLPDDLKGCAENLRKIHLALRKYEKDKGKVPDWLSDLVPDYLSAETLFCPHDPGHRSSYWPDPNGACSYCWELSPSELGSRPPLDKTMRHYKVLQRRVLGDVVPIVRCFHHDHVLNLAFNGQLYTSAEWFENLFVPGYSHGMLLAGEKAEPEPAATSMKPLKSPDEKAQVLAFDDFDGKLGLSWNVLHADPTHYSLDKKPGALTITTQDGHFKESHADYKNLFLIDTPVAEGQGFQVTTCLASFRPLAAYNQAGLICWDDQDNYLEWVYQRMRTRGLVFNAGVEAGGPTGYTYISAGGPFDKLWLRLTVRGNRCECSSSTDGKSYKLHTVARWGDGSPRRVGLFAINGSLTHPPEVDASFEFFELAAVPSEAPASDIGDKYENDLEAFIREIDRSYPFFELKGIRDDWQATCKRLRAEVKDCQSDEAFLKIVIEGVRCLRDAHLGFREINAKLPQPPPKYYPGISFMPATDERVVLMTDRTDLDADLKAGTVVTQIDGRDARRLLEERAKAAWAEGGGFSSPQRARLFEFRIPLRGEEKGEKHTVTILADGKQRQIELVSDVAARGWPHGYNRPENLTRAGRSCWHTKLPGGAGYIYLRYIDGSTGPGIKEAISTHRDAKGWIIDLRGNGGGGYDQALHEVLRGLPRPLAVLIDAGCTSAGETMARDLVRYGNARLFGSTTAGASSAKRTWGFPSGIATLSLPTRSRGGVNGRSIEFNGIKPDVDVEAVPEEIQRGLNSATVRAEEFLATL